MRTVLLLVDLINDSFANDKSRNLSKKRNALVNKVNELVGIARQKNWRIIWVRQQYKAGLSDMPRRRKKKKNVGPIEGEWEALFLSELDCQLQVDEIVIKTNYSAFYKTKLDEILERESKGKPYLRIIIGGVNTQACVYATAMDAFHRDHDVILAEDCLASYNGVFHEVSLCYLSQSIGELLNNREIEAEHFSETASPRLPYDSLIP